MVVLFSTLCVIPVGPCSAALKLPLCSYYAVDDSESVQGTRRNLLLNYSPLKRLRLRAFQCRPIAHLALACQWRDAILEPHSPIPDLSLEDLLENVTGMIYAMLTGCRYMGKPGRDVIAADCKSGLIEWDPRRDPL